MSNIGTKDYYLKNFISKMLGLIAAREFPRCYEGFVKVIVDNLQSSNDSAMVDMCLTIIYDILNESDDRFAVMTIEILPVILTVFKSSSVNNRI